MNFSRALLTIAMIAAALSLTNCVLVLGGGNSSTGGGYNSGSSSSVMAPGVFVATNGSDANSGLTAGFPVLSLSNAVAIAVATTRDHIYIGSGTYITNKGLNDPSTLEGLRLNNVSKLNISGGWNGSFTSQSGTSVINAVSGGYPYRVITMLGTSAITFDNLVIINGDARSTADFGGGLYISNCADTIVQNCTISNNWALRGAGVFIYGGSNNIISNCVLNANVSYTNSNIIASGAGAYLWLGMKNNMINSIITNNTANNSYCGGVVFRRGTNNGIYNSTIAMNPDNGDTASGYAIFLSAGVGDHTTNGLVNLTLSNNIIAGTSGSTYKGIREEIGTTTYINIDNQNIINNTFISNYLGFVYENSTGINSSTTYDTTSWNSINAPGNTGAAVASGNTIINW